MPMFIQGYNLQVVEPTPTGYRPLLQKLGTYQNKKDMCSAIVTQYFHLVS